MDRERASFQYRPWRQVEHDGALPTGVLWHKGSASALVADGYRMHKPRQPPRARLRRRRLGARAGVRSLGWRIRDHAFAQHHGRQRSIRTHEWGFPLKVDGGGPIGLHDRRRDPTEQANVAEEGPEVAERLGLRLRRWVATLASS